LNVTKTRTEKRRTMTKGKRKSVTKHVGRTEPGEGWGPTGREGKSSEPEKPKGEGKGME